MTEGSGRASDPKLPEGFVDAIGLDDESIPFKPFVVRPKGKAAAPAAKPQNTRAGGAPEKSLRDRTPVWGK